MSVVNLKTEEKSKSSKKNVKKKSKKLHSSETSKNAIFGRAKNERLRKPPPPIAPICLVGGLS